jgi:hypothetical protein
MIHQANFALLFVFWFYVILFVISPIVVRIQFCFRAKIDPRAIPLDEMPEPARAYIEPRVAEFAPWNFDLVACLSLNDVTPSAAAYVALLSNVHTAEWADVTFVRSSIKKSGYIEFVTRCSEQLQIDTNTSATAPIFFSVPRHHIFRFPQVPDVFTLYRIHRMLVTEITHGALPVIPPAGGEVAEFKRRLERHGSWQQEHGYMYLDASGENYRLTWKGAILATWRSIWPISTWRRWRQRRENRTILDRIGPAARKP